MGWVHAPLSILFQAAMVVMEGEERIGRRGAYGDKHVQNGAERQGPAKGCRSTEACNNVEQYKCSTLTTTNRTAFCC